MEVMNLMKLEPVACANSMAVIAAALYVGCRVLVELFPGVMFAVGQSWFHAVELGRLDSGSLTMSAFVLGVISATAVAWGTGYFFAKIYMYFARK